MDLTALRKKVISSYAQDRQERLDRMLAQIAAIKCEADVEKLGNDFDTDLSNLNAPDSEVIEAAMAAKAKELGIA